MNRRRFIKTSLCTASIPLFSPFAAPRNATAEQRAGKKPNILLIMNDDMGYSDLGCYGGEVRTPNLDGLAKGGVRYTQFYNTARCCPTRASLLTGLHPHQAGIGHMVGVNGSGGYPGDLSRNAVTIAEALKPGGYRTYMCGKWHVTPFLEDRKHNWPCQRGFDDYYGIITGAANYFHPRSLTRNNDPIEPEGDDYYLTDAISHEAVRQIREHNRDHAGTPFFQYVAYTAPHWPLHAREEDIAKYRGRFDAGWDKLREERLKRLTEMGILDSKWPLSPRDPSVPEWEGVARKKWQTRRMEVYAAQIDRMDQGIGRIFSALKETGAWADTLIVFLADNGGCAEVLGKGTRDRIEKGSEKTGTLQTRDGRDIQFGNSPDITPGGEETYSSYGVPWANVSNTPFRLYKHWVHEGGISTPFLAHWPRGIAARGELRTQPAQLPDVMATFLDVAGVPYPKTRDGVPVTPLEGFSLVPTFSNRPHTREALFWEHEGNKAIRRGKWKLVLKHPGNWELYDMEKDRTELTNLAESQPDRVKELSALHDQWAQRCGVHPWGQTPAQPKKSTG